MLLEGQDKLLEQVLVYTIETIPKNILFLGPQGCGKHTLAKQLADNLKLNFVEINNTISFESILDIQTQAIQKIYFIDLNNFTEKSQNTILKFLEEPLENTYIILASNSKYKVLPTIINRCRIFEFSAYSKDFLIKHIDKNQINYAEFILSICNTVGQLKDIANTNVNELQALCTNILENISKASLTNTLSISKKLNYKDEYDKLDAALFVKALKQEVFKNIVANNNEKYLKLYNILQDTICKIEDSRLNKEYIIQDMLIKIWTLMRGN